MVKYYKKIFEQVANELGLNKHDVEEAYKSYYHFIVKTIKEMNLNDRDTMSKEEFNSLRKSFNLPSLGKLSIKYDKYAGLKRMKKYYKENIENGRVQEEFD